jgi:hypothetical protein
LGPVDRSKSVSRCHLASHHSDSRHNPPPRVASREPSPCRTSTSPTPRRLCAPSRRSSLVYSPQRRLSG